MRGGKATRGPRRHRARRQAWLLGLACFLCGAGYAYREWQHGRDSTSASAVALPRSTGTAEADPDPTGAWLLADVPPEARPDVAADGIKAAFVILVGPNTTEELAETLENLHRHVLAHRPRPVLLFTPGDVPAGDAAALRTRLPRAVAAAVKLVPLPDFTQLPPEFRGLEIQNVAGQQDDTWVRRYPAYHNMCRWNLIGILAHPATRGLDYYCRLDTHSNILSNVSDDMFGHMAAHGLHYGFVASANEFPEVSIGMWDFAADWYAHNMTAEQRAVAERNGFHQQIPAPAARDKGVSGMVYNNFEIVHVPRFQAADITAFNADIDASMRIYSHRWGDSPLRWFQAMMFLDWHAEVHRFGFHYAHKIYHFNEFVTR